MSNHTKIPSENTKLFSSLPPDVAVLIIDVIDALASVLCWRQSSKSLLSSILSRLAERESFEKEHKNFSFAMWPHLEVSRRKEKFSRWLSNLKNDQKLSNIDLVWIENRRVKRNEGGEFKGLPTLYKRGKFWELFSCVQFVAEQCDLLAFSVDDRRAQVRDIVANWLKEAGAQKIIRVKKEKPEKSEKEKSARIEELRRQPNEDFNVDLDWFADQFKQRLCEVGLGREFLDTVSRTHHALDIAEQSARDLIVGTKTGGQLRLVGGQPK